MTERIRTASRRVRASEPFRWAAERRLARSRPAEADPGDAGAPLALAALDGLAAARPRIVVVGPRAADVVAALGDRVQAAADPSVERTADVVLSAGELESGPPAEAEDRLAALARLAPTVVALLPLWPEGRSTARRLGARTLRPRAWWEAAAARRGLEPLLSASGDAGMACLAFAEPPEPAGGAAPARRPRRSAPVCRVNDDLSVTASFSFISASIAIALDDAGVPVSIAPTRPTDALGPEVTRRIAPLIETGASNDGADCEIGWTHYWKPYRRPLGGRRPLPLFAINYGFSESDPAGFDPWLRGLIEGDGPIAPISAFCRDVLVAAGVEEARLSVVPMGYTHGIAGAEPGELPRARGLKLLHVTSASDLERNGTDIALDAFEAAFAPDDDVTLVVRGYAGRSDAAGARIAALAARGYDVRHLPVFFGERQLGRFLGAFDALLAPFRGEGFGIKLLDAMACGVPPIAPFFGGPRDFLTAETAFEVSYDLVPVRGGYDYRQLPLGNGPVWAGPRTDAVAATLRSLLADPAQAARRGAAAREHARSRFSWAGTTDRILEILDDD